MDIRPQRNNPGRVHVGIVVAVFAAVLIVNALYDKVTSKYPTDKMFQVVPAAAEGEPQAAAVGGKKSAVVPLRHAHAHNDYEHERPLFDALDHGFCSVEADAFLVGDQLQVGHTPKDLKPDRTLEKLYLQPLRERARANGGRVYAGGPTVFLLVDVKTEANATYLALDKVLRRYDDILSVARRGRFEPKAVTVVVSGNRARDLIAGQEVRYAAVDGRAEDLDSDVSAELVPWISERWGAQFRWQGDVPMPDGERKKLQEFVRKAHQRGRLVRFWATPERADVWQELLSARVDLINTDKLAELQSFLHERRSTSK